MAKFLDAYLKYTQRTYGPKPNAKHAYKMYETTEMFFKSHNPDLTGLFDLLFEKYSIIPQVDMNFSKVNLPMFNMVLWQYENDTMTTPLLIKLRINQSNVSGWFNSIMIANAEFKQNEDFFTKKFITFFMETISGCTISEESDETPLLTFPVAGNPTEMRMKLQLATGRTRKT